MYKLICERALLLHQCSPTVGRISVATKAKEIQNVLLVQFSVKAVSYTHLTLPTILRV